jgi:hypothetical protein
MSWMEILTLAIGVALILSLIFSRERASLSYFLAQNLTNLPLVQNRGSGRKVQDRPDLD